MGIIIVTVGQPLSGVQSSQLGPIRGPGLSIRIGLESSPRVRLAGWLAGWLRINSHNMIGTIVWTDHWEHIPPKTKQSEAGTSNNGMFWGCGPSSTLSSTTIASSITWDGEIWKMNRISPRVPHRSHWIFIAINITPPYNTQCGFVTNKRLKLVPSESKLGPHPCKL